MPHALTVLSVGLVYDSIVCSINVYRHFLNSLLHQIYTEWYTSHVGEKQANQSIPREIPGFDRGI